MSEQQGHLLADVVRAGKCSGVYQSPRVSPTVRLCHCTSVPRYVLGPRCDVRP